MLNACRTCAAPALFAFVLLLSTGARRGELYALRWADVDPGRRWAIFPRTKNGEARGVPLISPVVAELQRLRKVAIDETVFPHDMTRAWRTAVRLAGLGDFRFHDLRHSAASRLVQSGVNLAEIAQLLGHRDIRMTRRYAHVHSAHTQQLVDRVMEDLCR